MSRKLAYDPPRITARGDIRELTRAGTPRSVWAQLWMPRPNGDSDDIEPTLSQPSGLTVRRAPLDDMPRVAEALACDCGHSGLVELASGPRRAAA